MPLWPSSIYKNVIAKINATSKTLKSLMRFLSTCAAWSVKAFWWSEAYFMITCLLKKGMTFLSSYFQIARKKKRSMKMEQRSKSIVTDVPALAENGFVHQNFVRKSIFLMVTCSQMMKRISMIMMIWTMSFEIQM